jgi:hypothetical protein
LIAARDPGLTIKTLSEKHKFKLKGVGPLTYHLGCDYFCDDERTLCCGPRKNITKLMDQFENMYGRKPRKYTFPLEPDIDQTEELDCEEIKKY